VTLSGFLRSARFALTALATIAFAGGVIGASWYAAGRTTETQRADAVQRTNATVTGLAASYTEQINRQTLALDQTLSQMARDWEADPRRFNLEAERARAASLTGISRDIFMTDENGIIRQASVPDFIGQSAADLDVFRDAAEHTNDKPALYLGGASVNPIMRQWHLDAARTLHHPDGSFAGIIDTDYRVSAITEVFSASAPAGDGFAAVISLTDGKLRATFGAGGGTPDANIADTRMFAAVDADDAGLWVGPSATDAVVRVHAFRRVPGRDLAVIAGLSQQEAMLPVATWQRQARVFAVAIGGLTTIIVILILAGLRAGRRRAAKAADVQAQFAAAHALAEVSRARADAIERRLHATFAAVTDGVAIFDAHLNLVEWNAQFPERSGVNASFIRTGMPMEDVLRTQVMAGYFGAAGDVEAEVERRAALLRAGNFGASVSFQVAGRVIELGCRPLAEGGFVALYTDVTEGRRARQALRESRDTLRDEQSNRMRFLDVISHELTERVAMLMRSIAGLRAMDVPARALLPILRVGESLASLAANAVEVPLMEADAIVPLPALIGVRPLLRDIVDTIQPAARDHGITVYQIVNEATPEELIADPGRVRQIVTVLLTEALRFAAPDTMWLLADGGEDERDGRVALRVTIRGFGTPIPEPIRAGMFPSFDAVAVPGHSVAGKGEPSAMGKELEDPPPDESGGQVPGDRSAGGHVSGGHVSGEHATGTGLGPAVARHLATMMGGQLRCEGWSTLDGRTGNDFILTLPPDLLPGQSGRAPGEAPAEGRPLPRTRILFAGATTGLRMAAVTMLRRDGHMVDAVSTGEEAVRSLGNAPYDIAFADAALPDMTVETALATIRGQTGPARFVPVIVLAPPHEEPDERPWRDAGADGILGDHPALEDLAAAIGRHVWLNRSFDGELGFMPGLEAESEEGIPILSLQRIGELRSNLPREELSDMVEECIADLFHRLPPLRRALATGAVGAITAQAHAMVGMAGGYGMSVLEARLRAILTAVRARRLDTIDGAAAVVEADLTRAAAALRRMLRLPQPARSGVRT
jgi:CheY-like chemotaxis protein/signal transduction histidine kinase